MTVIRSKFSERQAGRAVCVDVLAHSPQSRARSHWVGMTSNLPVVQATTKYFVIPVLYDQIVQSISLVYKTVPVMSSGTATVQVDYVAVDGSTTTAIVAATSLLLLTTLVPLALTLAATNPASCLSGGSWVFTVVTSNNTVGTADVGGGLTMRTEPVEATVISDTNATIAG